MNTTSQSRLFCAMTIAGSDSGGGAGIQADILTFAAHGVYATSAIAAITAQNPDKVADVCACNTRCFAKQLELVNSFYKPKAAKTGMLFNAEIIEITYEFIAQNPAIDLVIDPVMISTSGAKLLKDDALAILKEKLIPLSKIFTPNLDEASLLLGGKKIDYSNQLDSAKKLAEKFSTAVLLKGGHLSGDKITDILVEKDGNNTIFESIRIKNVDTHGSGCTLSAAIAANLAKNLNLKKSCQNAHIYLIQGISNPLRIGGKNFINHFPTKK